jgi:hypothetical protein
LDLALIPHQGHVESVAIGHVTVKIARLRYSEKLDLHSNATQITLQRAPCGCRRSVVMQAISQGMLNMQLVQTQAVLTLSAADLSVNLVLRSLDCHVYGPAVSRIDADNKMMDGHVNPDVVNTVLKALTNHPSAGERMKRKRMWLSTTGKHHPTSCDSRMRERMR